MRLRCLFSQKMCAPQGPIAGRACARGARRPSGGLRRFEDGRDAFTDVADGDEGGREDGDGRRAAADGEARAWLTCSVTVACANLTGCRPAATMTSCLCQRHPLLFLACRPDLPSCRLWPWMLRTMFSCRPYGRCTAAHRPRTLAHG